MSIGFMNVPKDKSNRSLTKGLAMKTVSVRQIVKLGSGEVICSQSYPIPLKTTDSNDDSAMNDLLTFLSKDLMQKIADKSLVLFVDDPHPKAIVFGPDCYLNMIASVEITEA